MDALIQEIRQRVALARGGQDNIDAALADAKAGLPELAAQGKITLADIMRIDTQLRDTTDSMDLDTREAISELNLAAVQALDVDAVARDVALTRCSILLAIAQTIDPGQRKNALRRVTQKALDLATRYYLEEVDPNLIGDLHLQAGNVHMRGFGPTNHNVDEGLRHFLTGYRMKKAAANPMQLARLEGLMRRAAGFLIDFDPMGAQVNQDLGRRHQKLQTAADVFDTVGPEDVAFDAKVSLLRFYVENRFLDAAEPLLEELRATAENAPAGTAGRFLLYRADWLSQRYRAQESLDVLNSVPQGNAIDQNERLYAETIRANCLRLLHQYDDAYKAFLELDTRISAELAKAPNRIDLRGRKGLALSHLGYLDARRGQIEKGQSWFEQANTLFQGHLLTADEKMRSADMWAMGLYEAGEWALALDKYETALSLRSAISEDIADPEIRAGFMGAWAQIDARVIEIALRLDRPARALEVAEASKSRVLQEMARRHSAMGAASGYPDWSERAPLFESDAMLLRDYATLSSERAELEETLTKVPILSMEHSELDRQIKGVSKRLAAIQELVERRMAQNAFGKPRLKLDPVGISEIIGILPENSDYGLVSLHSSGEGTAVFVARAGDTKTLKGHWCPDWKYERLLEEVYLPWQRAQEAFSAGATELADWHSAIDKCRSALYEALWRRIAPVVAELGLRNLLILPHRFLHLIPFAALRNPDSEEDVLDAVETIVVAPGAGFLRTTAQRRPPDGADRAVFFGRPDADAALMAQETLCAADAWSNNKGRGSTTVCLGTSAHPLALYQHSKDATLIHLACHGRWNSERLQDSGLVMAPSPPGSPPNFSQTEGLLNVAALLTQLYTPNCRLVALSACESGLARRIAADEPVSVPMAFLLAGAHQVVASLWRVADDATLLFMGEFYRKYAAGEPAPASLASAQRWLRDLSVGGAIVALEEANRILDKDSVEPDVLQQAKKHLAEAVADLRALPADARPYRSADYWGAFICYGSPTA